MPPRSWPVLLALFLSLACVPYSRRADQGERATAPYPTAPTAGSWSLVALPDTQEYADSYPEIFYSQTAWIAANAERLNVKYVVHEGDITNDSSKDQWEIADHAIRLLDDRVPYALTMGNHDYSGDDRDASKFDKYFPPSRLAAQPGFIASFEESSAVNAAYGFTADGQSWLIFMLEVGPRDAVLAWVESVLAANPTSRAILVTHAYLFTDGTRFDHSQENDQYNNPHEYDYLQRGGVNDAQEMWDKLIVKNPAIDIVLCGHMHDQARLDSQRPDGSTVHQILADYQTEDKGGSGTLRVMTFAPDGKVQVRSYSPYLNRYRIDDDNDFDFTLAPSARDAGAERE